MDPIYTRVGLVAVEDVRFFGRSVFGELHGSFRTPFDGMAMALGVAEPNDHAREVLRLMMLCCTSADARIWPLKLCRLLASYGDPSVGIHGGGLAEVNRVMGPLTTQRCAEGMVFVAERVAAGASVTEAAAELRSRYQGRIPGFGVPFRREDERMVALRWMIVGTGLETLPYWRLQEQLVEAVGEMPNIALGMTAMALDLGLTPRQVGFATSACIAHTFVAHALEAAETDAAAHDLPAEALDYRGRGPRRLGEATSGSPPAGLRRGGGAPPAGARVGALGSTR